MSYQGNIIADTDISNWLGTETDAQEKALIDRCEEVIEKVTNEKFYQYTFTQVVDGNQKNRMMMPFLSNILSLTSITVDGIAISTDLYTFDGRFIYPDPDGILINGLTAIFSGNDSVLFPLGENNITIIGTCGYAVAPESIKRATIILVEYELDNSKYTHYISGSESMGSYSASHRREVLTGVLEADEILDLFVNRKARIFA